MRKSGFAIINVRKKEGWLRVRIGNGQTSKRGEQQYRDIDPEEQSQPSEL